jgi:competence ComEA-like helix-hairpin-helix protein
MPLSAGERLDPNRAPAEELDRLPGIGVVTAEAIIRTRESGGPFAHIQDLERVPGIGPAMLRRLAPTLDLDDPPVSRRPSSGSTPERVELNRATEEELTALPGIGPALAARIVAARVEAPFTSVEDLVRVRGIGPATVERLRPLARVGLGR